MQEEQTPNPNNTCKIEVCGGTIVKQVSSLFRGKFEFRTPECEKCGRRYANATSAIPVGVREFKEQMRRPFTI